MNKALMINGAYLFAGCAIGVMGSMMYFREKYKEKYKMIAEKEISEMRAEYWGHQPPQPKPDPSAVVVEEKKEVEEEMKRNVETYSSMVSVYANDEEMAMEKLNESENEDVEATPYPYLIDQEEYDNNTAFEKTELSFYTEDKILVTTEFNEDIVDIPELLVGDLLKKSGFYYDLDTRVLHVRNPKLLTDFQITKCYGAYADVDTR